MSELSIRIKIPVVRDGNYSEQPSGGITFAAWLPEQPEEAITVHDGNITCEIWFDRSTIQPTVTRLPENSYWTPMEARTARCMVTVKDITPALKEYVETIEPTIQEDLQAEYDVLAERVIVLVTNTYNKIVRYLRDYLGQYWIAEIATGDSIHDRCLQFDCRVPISDGRWLLFCPSPGLQYLEFVLDDSRHLNTDHWKSLRVYVERGRRSPRFRTLLTGAEEIAAKGHSRAALLEAIAALEAAVRQFVQSPHAMQYYDDRLRDRMKGASLAGLAHHLGLTTSVSFLLPLIIPEDNLATKTINDCREAIEERNNVIHNGQQKVEQKRLKKYLMSIRAYCTALESPVLLE